MDLSSLEGPPIADFRFTVSMESSKDIMTDPRIRIDTGLASALPRHPASACDSPRPKADYHSSATHEQSPRVCRRCHSRIVSTGDLDISSPHEARSPTSLYPSLNLPPPPPASSFAYSPWASRSRSMTDLTLQPTHSTGPLPREPPVQQASQLIWLESEALWVLKPCSSSSSAPYLSPLTPRPMHSSTRSAAHPSYPSVFDGYASDSDYPDQPPPYEQHVYDRPFAPFSDRARADGSGRRSRWSAVARRRAIQALSG
ncbi:uncharacterized protein BP01DRAFT_105214 [Aspergillus saccharolyticus JOP 1030-1]|uniref:Uncharacterized protein n=1 Tax=Aspergillus saccharolyticus JOP 1030-1 TaxID=1450539 RepID=A0A318ZHM9_9EURO|nr:hypothetical protein BP01DRAFT_105214 [Aspergillus saccharolyticus JOP 1030-1]PYH43200.1 hypothetical protein BP01DRAFT_105214 [Aspergillus saccharolyticus JOP 1030-1]